MFLLYILYKVDYIFIRTHFQATEVFIKNNIAFLLCI